MAQQFQGPSTCPSQKSKANPRFWVFSPSPHPITKSHAFFFNFWNLHSSLFLKKLYWFLERKEERGGGLRERLVVLGIDAFIGWFFYVPSLGIEPTTLAYRDVTLTNWATQPGAHFAPSSVLRGRTEYVHWSGVVEAVITAPPYCLAMEFYASNLTSLCFIFLICKQRVTKVTASKSRCFTWKAFRTIWLTVSIP